MSYGVKIIDLASSIYLDINETDPFYNITRIANWLRGQVGTLNSLINENFFINNCDEMSRLINIPNHNNTFEYNPDIQPNYPISQVFPTGQIPKFTSIHNDEAGILKKMYMIFYYDSKFRKVLNSLNENLALSVESDGQKISLVNRNSIAQSYLQMKKTEIEELKKIINGYLRNRSNPRQVVGDDTVSEWGYGDLSDSINSITQERFYSY